MELSKRERYCFAAAILITLCGAIFKWIDIDSKYLVLNWFLTIVMIIFGCIHTTMDDIKSYLKNIQVLIPAILAEISISSIFQQMGLKIFILSECMGLFAFILFFGKLSITWKKSNRLSCERRENPAYNSVIIFIYSLCSLFLYWLAIGFATDSEHPDAINQWNQIHTGQYSDIHAIGHTIYLKGILSIWDSHVPVIIVNIIMLAGLYAVFSYIFSKRKIPLYVQFLIVSIFTSGFCNIFYYFTPLKDVPYTVCASMLTLMLIRRIYNRENCGIGYAVLIGIFVIWIGLFRLNGMLITIFCGEYMIISFIRLKQFKQLIVMLLTMCVIYGGIHWYAYDILKTESPVNGCSMQEFGSGIAAAMNDGKMTADEREEIDALFPMSDWIEEQYSPGNGFKLLWEGAGGDFVNVMGEKKVETVRLYFNLLPRHFETMIKDIWYNTQIVWGHLAYSITHSDNVYADNSSLSILLISAILCLWNMKIMKNNWIVFIPVILNMLTIAAATITRETRYMLPTVAIFPILLLFVIEQYRNNASGFTESREV